MARIALALLASAVCLLLMREAARIGFSRLLTRYALITNSLPAADQAVQITPSDPEAHRARALILNRLRRPAEAEASLEVATSLRDGPEDLWIELGNTREELGDREGALAAFDRAVSSAPYYAHTHWQRGNLLLRMGRYEEAFADLREAAAANKKYFPNLLALAWGLTGDARATEALLQLQNENDRLTFAQFLAGKGRATDVVDQVRLLSNPLSEENKDELVRLLSASKKFSEAFELWRGGKPEEGIVNGSFEEPLVLDKVVFHWGLLQSQPKVKLAVDVYERASGARSLQAAFDGEWDLGATLLWQTILIEPGRRYQLKFFVKTKDLVTGGPPRIVLTDAINDRIIAKSDPFPSGSGEWSEMKVDFTAQSQAIFINLVRDNCASSPCPIFGVVWLDDFSLQKL